MERQLTMDKFLNIGKEEKYLINEGIVLEQLSPRYSLYCDGACRGNGKPTSQSGIWK